MYEKYLWMENGIKEIEIKIPDEDIGDEPGAVSDAVKLVLTFAVTTDSEAWLTLHGNGRITTAFGGTGMTTQEVKSYVDHAIEMYRTITGDAETDFHRPARMSGP